MTMTMDQNKKTAGTKRALGRGLDALFASAPVPEVQTGGASAISEIELNLIEPNPEQPRRTFDPEALEELAASIRELGIVQPLTLRSVPGGRYQIIAGERRWRAATRAGLVTVPGNIKIINVVTPIKKIRMIMLMIIICSVICCISPYITAPCLFS